MKYEKYKLPTQTFINIFKDLKNRKLTIFNLKIAKIIDITNVKMDELKSEFTKFLKSQSNLKEFKLKLNTPIKLEAINYFP